MLHVIMTVLLTYQVIILERQKTVILDRKLVNDKACCQTTWQ
jgi:hypothetical protein